MTITTRLHTHFHGALVGTDAQGNRYFTEKGTPRARRARRWVRYAHAGFWSEIFGGGSPDPSRVPPEWHGWLHYTTDTPPTKLHRAHHGWEKPAQPNLTGTAAAYFPPGHLARTGEHAATSAQYEAWKP